MSDELAGLVLVVLLVYLLAEQAVEERSDETAAAIWMLEQSNGRRA